jgi:hypothetical protein
MKTSRRIESTTLTPTGGSAVTAGIGVIWFEVSSRGADLATGSVTCRTAVDALCVVHRQDVYGVN